MFSGNSLYKKNASDKCIYEDFDGSCLRSNGWISVTNLQHPVGGVNKLVCLDSDDIRVLPHERVAFFFALNNGQMPAK